jgi:hypothetical protein
MGFQSPLKKIGLSLPLAGIAGYIINIDAVLAFSRFWRWSISSLPY